MTLFRRSGKGKWGDAEFAWDIDAAAVDRPSPQSQSLLFITILFFAVMGVWAHYAVIDQTTHADGRVIPSSKVQVIQNLEGGILEEILVKEGEVVKPGQVLVRIDDTGVAASYGELETRREQLRSELVRLTAESSGAPLIIPEDKKEQESQILEGQISLYQARQQELKSQVDILRQQADQKVREKSELQSTVSQLEASLALAREEFEINKPLAAKGVVPKVDMLRLRREITELTGELRTTRLALQRIGSAITEHHQRIEEKQLTFKAAATSELMQKKGELQAVEEAMTAASDKVVRTEVLSPVRGIVKEIKKRTIGGVIQPAEDILELVPLDDQLLVEARVTPADVAFLRPNQKATVKLTAYDFSIFGGLEGKLERISADTIRDEQGNDFFHIIVRTEKNHLKHKGEILPIIPGMVASVDVKTGEKSVLMYLMKPILKVKERALTER